MEGEPVRVIVGLDITGEFDGGAEKVSEPLLILRKASLKPVKLTYQVMLL